MRIISLALLALLALAGCERLDRLGRAPDFSPMQAAAHDQQLARTVSMPMPQPYQDRRRFNSLWTPGDKDFFVDVRAKQIGDIVTVLIEIDDEARLRNETERERLGNEEANLNRVFGLEEVLDANGLNLDPAIDFDSQSRSQGRGEIDRNEQISLQIAAVVTDVLPNGNFAIAGRQEVLVNYEMRDLRIAGVVRPVDINADNEVEFRDIAEARIAYAGRGQITDVQQPRYGQQIYDIFMPW